MNRWRKWQQEEREKRMRSFFEGRAKQEGYGDARVEEEVKRSLLEAVQYDREKDDKEYRYVADNGIAGWLADQIEELRRVRETFQYEDLPQRSPIPGITDTEWRQGLAEIQRRRELRCASTVDSYTISRRAKDVKHDLTYIHRLPKYAKLEHLEYYAEQLRQAERGYAEIANALEAERRRIEA